MKGLVLAGGKSRRFGSDKATFVFPGRGELLTVTLNLFAAIGMEAPVSCRPEQKDHLQAKIPSGIPIITDYGNSGAPLCGITAGLRALQTPLLVLACDLPLLQTDLLITLVEARNRALQRSGQPERHLSGSWPSPLPGKKPLLRTAFIRADGTIETLAAVYEPASLYFLEHALGTGSLSLYRAIPPDSQILVPCPDDQALLNMNTPADRELALSLHAGQRSLFSTAE